MTFTKHKKNTLTRDINRVKQKKLSNYYRRCYRAKRNCKKVQFKCWSHIKWLWIINRICKHNNLTHHSMISIVVTYKYWNRFVLWFKEFINCKQCSLEQRKRTFTQMSLTPCTDVLPKTKLLQNKYSVHVELNPLWSETPLEWKRCLYLQCTMYCTF